MGKGMVKGVLTRILMTNNQEQSAIEVSDLTVTLGEQTIIDTMSFTVPTGQTTAIIGPNGAGKSVLLKSMLGLLPKQSGSVSFFGTPHEQYSKIAHDISYIPQYVNRDETLPLTIEGLFTLQSSPLLGITADDKKQMHELLTKVGVTAKPSQLLHTLSGGQLQRVLIAYSLIRDPKLLILDEPSAGIDIEGQETIYTLLERLQTENNLTLLLISHELDIVMQFADQVLCVNKKLLCAGVPREALSKEILEEIYGDRTVHYHHDHTKSEKDHA